MTLVIVLSVVVWLIGAIVATPGQLRRRMNAKICSSCGCGWCWDNGEPKVPRGEIRSRDMIDVWAAFVTMLFWPPIAVAYAGYGLIWCITQALGKPVLSLTKLTPGEQRRIEREQAERIRKQQAEISRLTEEIHAGAGDESWTDESWAALRWLASSRPSRKEE